MERRMAENNLDRYCSQCEQLARVDFANMGRAYAAQALVFPYFLCSSCRLICIDKLLIKKWISAYRQRNLSAQRIPFREIYQNVKDFSEEIRREFRRIGYKQISPSRFATTRK